MSGGAALLVALATVLAVSASAADGPPVEMEFANRTLTVRGATPRGRVAVLSIHQTVYGPGYTHRSVWHFTADAGADGVATVTTPGDIDPERIWLAVDESTARDAVKRTGSATEIRRVPPGQLKHLAESDGGGISIPLSMAHVLVVRASEGSWLGRVADGGTTDSDGAANGRIRLAPDTLPDMQGKGRKQIKFKKGDLILAIDPVTMQVVEERLP